MNAINWFEIPVVDMDRAVRFYDQVLGTPLKRDVFMDVPHAIFPYERDDDAGGALVYMPERKPSNQGVVLYLNTRALDACLTRVAKAGGKVVREKTDIGPMGTFAWIQDSEGNLVGLHQPAQK